MRIVRTKLNMEPIQTSNWLQSCLQLYQQGNTTEGLVNGLGESVNVLDNNTWGISRAACYQYCGPDKLHQVCKLNSAISYGWPCYNLDLLNLRHSVLQPLRQPLPPFCCPGLHSRLNCHTKLPPGGIISSALL